MIHHALGRRAFLRRAGIAGLGGLGLSTGLGRRALAADPTTLNIINPAGPLTLVLEEMLKEGRYFDNLGLKTSITNVSDGSKVIAALLSGSGDYCTGSGFSGVFPAVEKGAKLKIIAGASIAPEAALFSKRPEIKELKDLVGRTVATGAPGTLLHELAVGAMIKKGVDYTQVKFVNIGSLVQTFIATAGGTVDAGFGSPDVFQQQEKYGVHALTDGVMWNELPEYANQAMITSDQAIAEKRDLLVKGLAAHAKLYRYIDADNSEQDWAKAYTVAMGKDSPVEAQALWKFYHRPGQLAVNLTMTAQQFDFIQNLNVRLGVQKTVLPFDQVADMSLAQDALKLIS